MSSEKLSLLLINFHVVSPFIRHTFYSRWIDARSRSCLPRATDRKKHADRWATSRPSPGEPPLMGGHVSSPTDADGHRCPRARCRRCITAAPIRCLPQSPISLGCSVSSPSPRSPSPVDRGPTSPPPRHALAPSSLNLSVKSLWLPLSPWISFPVHLATPTSPMKDVWLCLLPWISFPHGRVALPPPWQGSPVTHFTLRSSPV
jgi:hypothetical protein